MKVTKTVEVEICDRCKEEMTWPLKCSKCGREICANCKSHYRVEVKRSSEKITSGGMKTWTLKHIKILGCPSVNYYANYCDDCGQGIEQELMKCGFLPMVSKESPSTVLD